MSLQTLYEEALGKRGEKVPDWRWFLRTDKSPWYPSMTLFRQTAHGDWAGVFAQMQAQLKAKVAK